MILSTLILISVAHAECDKPTTTDLIAGVIPRAQIAIGSLDSAGFEQAVAEASHALECLGQPISPIDAANYHGLMGLASAFAGGQDDRAVRSFNAATAIMPTFALPWVIAPRDGPIDLLVQKARSQPIGKMVPVPPSEDSILIDGTPGIMRPVERPCILQIVSRNGDLIQTFYLQPEDPLPHWNAPRTPLQRLIPTVRKQPSTPLGIAAGTTAVAAGTAYILGGIWHEQYIDPSTPYEDLPALESQTNIALGTSIVLGATAATLTTVTFVRW